MKSVTFLALATLPLLAACGSTDRLEAPNLPVVEAGVAYPPPYCPDWNTDPTSNHANDVLPGHGCAYYRNLIVQMEDPRDYVHGRELGPSQDTYRNQAIISGYRSNNAAPAPAAPVSIVGQ